MRIENKDKSIVSRCCKSVMMLDGMPDFVGTNGWENVCTMSYVCRECGRYCDITKVSTPFHLRNFISNLWLRINRG